MERIKYKQMPEILDYIYNWFGAHLLFTNPDVEEWDERANRERAMRFLGHYAKMKKNNIKEHLEKSIWGVDIEHSK